MPVKITEKDLESIEAASSKENDLINEGLGYVKDLTISRIGKVILLYVLQWLFLLLSVALLLVFIYSMLFNTTKFSLLISQVVNVSGFSDEERLWNWIKIIRISLLLFLVLCLINAYTLGNIRKKIQTNNNIQIIFEELKSLLQKRKAKFNL